MFTLLYWLRDLLWPMGHHQIWSKQRLGKIHMQQGLLSWNDVTMIWRRQSSLFEDERLYIERDPLFQLSAAPTNSPPECCQTSEPGGDCEKAELPSHHTGGGETLTAVTWTHAVSSDSIMVQAHMSWSQNIVEIQRPSHPTLLQTSGNQKKERTSPSKALAFRGESG